MTKKTTSNRARKTVHPEGKTILRSFRIPFKLFKRLERWAKKEGVNNSNAATEAIRRLVKRVK